MQEWIWRDVRLEIPGDWEMLQFSRARDKGRCAYADRRQFRLELSWRQVKGAPDFPRMMADYKARLESAGELQDAHTFTLSGWHGLAGMQKNLRVSRFGNYFDKENLLAELVFLWPDKRDIPLENDILQSCRYAPPENGFRKIKAFGMSCRSPEKYEFTACSVQPAMAAMVFSGARRPARIRLQRFGMVPQWLDQPLTTWAGTQLPKEARNPDFESRSRNGHEIVTAKADYAPRGFLIRKGLYAASAWICPKDGRLYHAEQICRSAKDIVNHPLDCCGGMS